jgi:3-phenylpropionate/trans-cinnamate dioxygenase ferredoxin reductase subunit
MIEHLSVVVLGAGHSGGAMTSQLRQAGFTGPLTLVGDEPELPYQRPPLSKAWLMGKTSTDSLLLKPDSYYKNENITLISGVAAIAVDCIAREVTLVDGRRLPYDKLILATGARARPLPSIWSDGFLSLRNLRDARSLRAALIPGRRLAIIGGGYIGLEVASSARALGCRAVIIERETRVLARVACPALSRFFQDYHRERGVELVLGAEISAIESTGDAWRIKMEQGEDIACDTVLVGIGAVPNDELARAAGIDCQNGVIVDGCARSSDPDIFAIGDVSVRPLPIHGRSARLESIPSALEQARIVTATLMGTPLPAPEVPWFWSDQFDLKLQIAGVQFDTDMTVTRGDFATARFAVFHLHRGRIQAVEAVNAPQEFLAGKTLIARQSVVDPEKLKDMKIRSKDLLVAS